MHDTPRVNEQPEPLVPMPRALEPGAARTSSASEARQRGAPTRVLAYALMLVACLVWGSTWLVIKVGLQDLPPLTSAAIRIVLAGVVMAALCPWLVRLEGGGRPPLGVVLLQGACQFALNYALVYYAETRLPSGLVSVLWSVFPLFMAIAGHFVTGAERLRSRQWLGIVVAFMGVLALFVTDVTSVGPGALGVGLLLLLAPASVALSTTLIKQRASRASSLLVNRDSMLFGGALLALLSVALERDASLRWSPAAVASIAYLALPGTVLTFGVYVWLLRHLPAYVLALSSYLVPVTALLFGALVAGEPLGVTTLFGTGLVLLGVAAALGRVARR